VEGTVREHDGLQLTPVGFVKFDIENGAAGGVKDPAVDLNASAVITPPPGACTVTVGAVPLVAAKFMPLPMTSVVYGALQEFQAAAPLPPSICMTASVALRVSPTPVQVMHETDDVDPEASRDAVEPDGGRISTKFAPKKAPDPPERFTVMLIVPALPVRL
jgi:hypothetical protein